MQDVSGYGLQVNITASNTFPAGFTVTQFADDADPMDMAAIKLADVAMGLNGDLISWSKAVPVPMVLNVIPGSEDDINLSILADANRVAKGKLSARDEIFATVVYPDGQVVSLYSGKLTDSSLGRSVSSGGKIKTKTYTFAFENKTGV